MRGEGLLIGLRAVVPNGELVDALRAEKMITVAAGDNVVRLLPPLIVSEAEIAEAVGAARPRLRGVSSKRRRAAQAGSGRMSATASAISSISSTFPQAELRGDASRRAAP